MQIDAIIERAKAKDPKALSEIYTIYYPKMVRVCMNIVKEDEDMAHDLVHDAFVLAYASLNTLKDNEKFGEWLTTIVRNVAIKHIVHKRRLRLDSLSQINPNQDCLIDDSYSTDSSINCNDIFKLISQLPEGYRKVFNLSVIDGYSHQEIANILNIDSHSSSSQLSRAKSKLKRMMKYISIAFIILLISIPLYIFMAWHDEHDEPIVCEIKPNKKKQKKQKTSVSSESYKHIQQRTIKEPIDKTDAVQDISDSIIVPHICDLQNTYEMLTTEDAKDCTTVTIKDSFFTPTIDNVPVLVNGKKHKENKWQILTAGSLSSALAQNIYKLLTPDYSGDISSGETTIPIKTWEDYSRYLLNIQHENTQTDTLALIKIASHNTGDILEREEHDKPLTFGISFCKILTDRWSIETGLQYSLLNSRFTMGESGYSIVKKQKAHYLGIPLKLSYRLFDYKHISAYSSTGLTLHIPMYGKQTCNYIVNWQTAYSDNYHFTPAFQWQTSLSVGLQYKFTPNASVFVEPTINWFVPSNSDKHTIWTEQPIMFTSPFGIRITW